MVNLEQTLRHCNIFAKSYAMIKEEIDRQQELLGSNTEPELQLLFSLKPSYDRLARLWRLIANINTHFNYYIYIVYLTTLGYDRNQYNLQRTNEVAAVFVTGADDDIPESYVTIRNKNTQLLLFISSMDPNVEPMVYPLLYPHGTLVCHKNMMKKK